jgi:hypothetical protein
VKNFPAYCHARHFFFFAFGLCDNQNQAATGQRLSLRLSRRIQDMSQRA